MGNIISTFEDLECWKASRDVRRFVMGILKKFPREEMYALTDNMKRASRSITENIAEGFGRYHYQENIQFCRISRGSLHEIVDQLITANDEEYISNEDYQRGRELVNKALLLLNGYIKYLIRAKEQYKNSEVKEEIGIYNIITKNI
ncbi:MAG: four helix bundle protein [Bacteroidales bacterium]|nr:four helix bundle protein [Bacteroidales bacterium]